ncbi:MAG TPA: molybdopterin molybdotransferase MoeA, partial [Longimicrobiaceae bacterium]|nr:molybdopterin molybdotransferase MoeA [Longimicrobiaceae bacterium]
ADRVVPFERTERLAAPPEDEGPGAADREGRGSGGREVLFHAALAAGDNIRRRGEATRAGAPLLPAGTVLGPADLALLATHGFAAVRVHRAPRVAVLTTGDEVVPPDEAPRPGQLRDSHTDYLLAAGARLGLVVEPLGIAPDRPRALVERLGAGLAAADVLLVGGGVSAGELDFVEGALAELGCRALFTGVAIQPGKPLVAAVREGAREDGHKLVFGLPGNPASVLVTWRLFARPALERLLGRPASPFDRLLPGELAAPAPGTRGRDRFLPARLEHRDGRLLVHPVAIAGSHDLAAYARGPALLHLPAHSPPLPAGAPCRVLPEP